MRFHICRKALFSKLSHCRRIIVFLTFPFNQPFWWHGELSKDGFSMFLTRWPSSATKVRGRRDASTEPWTRLVPDERQWSLSTAGKQKSQLRQQLCSLCRSRSMLQGLWSFLARHPLRAWTHLCAQVYDSNCLSPVSTIKGHNPTKGLLLTLFFKASLLRRRLWLPENIFLFYFREKVSTVWYHCANIFNSM